MSGPRRHVPHHGRPCHAVNFCLLSRPTVVADDRRGRAVGEPRRGSSSLCCIKPRQEMVVAGAHLFAALDGLQPVLGHWLHDLLGGRRHRRLGVRHRGAATYLAVAVDTRHARRRFLRVFGARVRSKSAAIRRRQRTRSRTAATAVTLRSVLGCGAGRVRGGVVLHG
jgi:hypothetical protein